MTLSLATAVLVIAVTFIVTSIIRFYLKVNKYPRGPFPLPLLGNLLEFGNKSLLPHQVFDGIARRSGRGIFTFWISSYPIVVVSSYDQCRELYHEKKNTLASRPILPCMEKLEPHNELDMTLRPPDSTWSIHRKITSKSMQQSARSPQRAKFIGSLIDQFIHEMKKGNCPVDPTVPLGHMMFCAIADTALSRQYALDDPIVSELVESIESQVRCSGVFVLVHAFPAMKCLFKKSLDQVESVSRAAESFLDPMVAERRKIISATDGQFDCQDLLDEFIVASLEESRAEKKLSLTDEKIVATMWGMILGGVHTPKETLRWAILILAFYPEKTQADLRKEVKSVAGDDSFEFTFDYLRNRCPLLEAFIAEVLRFRSNGPLGVPRCALEDIHVNDVVIPKGTTVFLNFESALFSEKSWQSPEQFNLHRFLDENGNRVVKNPAFMPFSVGRRACVGEPFARANLLLILFKLIAETESITLANRESISLKPDLRLSPFQAAMPYEILLE